MGTRRIRIDNEYHYIDNLEDFLALTEQNLGWDAHDYLEELFSTIYEYLDEALDITISKMINSDEKIDSINETIRSLLQEIK